MTVQQESIPAESREAEIPRITFTIRNTSLGPRHWGPGGGDFFQLFYSSRGRSVSIRIDENLASFVILGARWLSCDLNRQQKSESTNRLNPDNRFPFR